MYEIRLSFGVVFCSDAEGKVAEFSKDVGTAANGTAPAVAQEDHQLVKFEAKSEHQRRLDDLASQFE